jgi:hypothetical protein
MDIEYDLIPYSKSIEEAYLRLLPEQEQAVAQGKLKWKFDDNPAGAGLIATARSDEEVVGVNAFMANRFKIGDGRAIGFQSMDTIVSPAARGKGVFGKLVGCFYERADAALLYGFPNLNSSPAFFGKLGWTSFGPVPMLIRPLRTGYFLRRVSRFFPDVRLPIFGKKLRNPEPITRFGDWATASWQRFSRTIACAVERDADFLNWRLQRNPSGTYRVLRAPDDGFIAYTVVEKHGGRIGYLMEAVGDERTLAALIRTGLKEMQDDGADAVLAWCPAAAPNRAAHHQAGFHRLPGKLRTTLVNFGARALKDRDPAISQTDSWYVSYLDSDTV